MVRRLGGIAAGLAAAIVLMIVIEGLGSQLPAPAGRSGPGIFTFLFAVVGALAAALAGGWVAIRVSDVAWTAWAVTAVILVATLLNVLLMTYPTWVIIAAVIAPLIGGWAATRLGSRAEPSSG